MDRHPFPGWDSPSSGFAGVGGRVESCGRRELDEREQWRLVFSSWLCSSYLLSRAPGVWDYGSDSTVITLGTEPGQSGNMESTGHFFAGFPASHWWQQQDPSPQE